MVKFGYSFSNTKDKYDKKVGKSISETRAMGGYEVTFSEKPTYLQIDCKIFMFILIDFNAPLWAKKLIQIELDSYLLN